MLKTIDHIGLCVIDLEKAASALRRALDVRVAQHFVMDLGDGVQAICVAFDWGSIQIVLAQERGAGGPLAAWLAEHGPGLHHVAFAVEDIDEAIEWCRGHGVPLMTEAKVTGAGVAQIMTAPDPETGLIIELIERSEAATDRFVLSNARELMAGQGSVD